LGDQGDTWAILQINKRDKVEKTKKYDIISP
jgi:hypothetical protein